jgi:RimJ/RimL family protein N-acetyltransferase
MKWHYSMQKPVQPDYIAPATGAATIRRLIHADAPAFFAMRQRCMREAFDFFRSSPADIEADGLADCEARLQSPHVRIVGAFEHDHLIGIGGITRENRDKLRHKALLWGMFVVPDVAGRGIGEAIVHALIGEAQGFVQSLHLTLLDGNARAQNLYERCGFTLYGCEPGSVMQPGGAVDELLMYLAIDS